MRTRMLLLLSFGVLTIISNSGCAPLHHGHAGLIGPAGPPGPAGTPYSVDPVFSDTWSGVTAGAAAGYCLAKHPYQSNTPGLYTSDGYEKVRSPGVVGAVRRNYVSGRTTTATDAGVNQTCAQACRELGKGYEPAYQGRALRQQVSGGTLITSGIGDMASMATPDHDFYTGLKTVAGILSRANTFHESDVAQADYCCCDVSTP